MGKHLPTQAENPKGLHQRYEIRKIVPNEINIAGAKFIDPQVPYRTIPIDEGAEYFIMRLDEGGSDPDHIKACRIGIHAYADAIEGKLPVLANDLRLRYPLMG